MACDLFQKELQKQIFYIMAMTRSRIFLTALCFIGLIVLIAGFEASQIQHHINVPLPKIKHPSILQSPVLAESECTTASIYEYINRFQLPLKDISKLLANQFSRNQIQDFEAEDKVKLFNINTVSKLLSNDQTESSLGPLKATVFNNQIEFTLTFKLNITEGILKKTHTFNAVTKVTNISLNYEKEFKLETGSFVINSATVKFDINSMTTSFEPKPNSTEESSFNTAIKGSTKSLYTALVKMFSNDIIKSEMQKNCKGEHLSQIYPENPYNYQYYSKMIKIDLSTLNFFTKETSLTTGMAGKFPSGNSVCNGFVPDFTNTGSSLFISKAFIQNFIEYNIGTYEGWKNIRIDKTTVRQNLLQWQLLDLDFIVDGLWNDLGQFTQNEIYFTCSIQSQIDSKFDITKNTLHQTMSWTCQGYVRLNQTSSQKVLDFTPRINHITELRVSSGYLVSMVNQVQLVDCTFNDVTSLDGSGKYTVSQDGAKMARKYMESLFYEFRVYTIGTYFKVKSDSTGVQVEKDGNGLWLV